MHILPFTLKRAHFATLKILQRFAAKEGLTPARFDLLFALQRQHGRHIQVPRAPVQRNLAKWLGVTRATVCKMVRALRKLGFLEMEPYTDDRRYKRIALTPHGLRCFRRLLRVLRRGKINAAMRAAYKTMSISRAETHGLIGEMVERILRFSRGIGEFTTFYAHPRRIPMARLARLSPHTRP